MRLYVPVRTTVHVFLCSVHCCAMCIDLPPRMLKPLLKPLAVSGWQRHQHHRVRRQLQDARYTPPHPNLLLAPSSGSSALRALDTVGEHRTSRIVHQIPQPPLLALPSRTSRHPFAASGERRRSESECELDRIVSRAAVSERGRGGGPFSTEKLAVARGGKEAAQKQQR